MRKLALAGIVIVVVIAAAPAGAAAPTLAPHVFTTTIRGAPVPALNAIWRLSTTRTGFIITRSGAPALAGTLTIAGPKVTFHDITGIDHAVVMAENLDGAAERWKRLGFTVSPRGTHSAQMGTGNYTIMLDGDYIELLGVLAPTEHNAPARAFLQKREGIERVAFTASDAAAAATEVRARGLVPMGPTDFERPVTMPDGKMSAAKFRSPRSALAPPVSTAAFTAAGFSSGLLLGASASIRFVSTNPTRSESASSSPASATTPSAAEAAAR